MSILTDWEELNALEFYNPIFYVDIFCAAYQFKVESILNNKTIINISSSSM